MHFDLKSFGIGLAVGAAVRLVICVALLQVAEQAINHRQKTAKPGPTPALIYYP